METIPVLAFADPAITGLIDSIALLDDGCVLCNGASDAVRGQTRPLVARLVPDDQLDASFVDASLRGNVSLRHMQSFVDGSTRLASAALIPCPAGVRKASSPLP